jgi:hypothetical protein
MLNKLVVAYLNKVRYAVIVVACALGYVKIVVKTAPAVYKDDRVITRPHDEEQKLTGTDEVNRVARMSTISGEYHHFMGLH